MSEKETEHEDQRRNINELISKQEETERQSLDTEFRRYLQSKNEDRLMILTEKDGKVSVLKVDYDAAVNNVNAKIFEMKSRKEQSAGLHPAVAVARGVFWKNSDEKVFEEQMKKTSGHEKGKQKRIKKN